MCIIFLYIGVFKNLSHITFLYKVNDVHSHVTIYQTLFSSMYVINYPDLLLNQTVKKNLEFRKKNFI